MDISLLATTILPSTKLIDILGACINLVAVYLGMKNKPISWLFVMLGTIIWLILFYRVSLYAEALLQCFFFITAIIGFYLWLFVNRNNSPLKITRINYFTWLIILLIFIALLTLTSSYFILYTIAHYPIWDSIILSLSIIGQFMLIFRKIENWLIWIAVNMFAIPLYYTQGIYFTMITYCIFLLLSIRGYFAWNNMLKQQKCVEPTRSN